MSITLDDFDVDPQTKPVLRVALERIRVSSGLTDDLADGIIAKQIIELAKAGERDPNLLREGAIDQKQTNGLTSRYVRLVPQADISPRRRS